MKKPARSSDARGGHRPEGGKPGGDARGGQHSSGGKPGGDARSGHHYSGGKPGGDARGGPRPAGRSGGKPAAPPRGEGRHAERGKPPSGGLVISAASVRFVQAGHPWVTRDRETGDTGRFRPGDVKDLIAPDGSWVARALIDPDARIVARVLTHDRKRFCDELFFRQRALEALRLREGLEQQATMYRLVNAEADGLPGLTVDRYEDWLVAQLYTPAAERLALAAVEALREAGGFRGAFLKTLPRDRRGAEDVAGQWVSGEAGPEAIVAREHGLKLQVRPFEGLSTGIFLDQRDNRQRIAALARGRRVLNAFSYTGAFSVACAAAGATVDTVDLSAKSLAWARENFSLNALDPEGHGFVAADAFPFLAEADGRYDVVILDPPTFSTSRGNIWSPARLAELNALAIGATKPGGWLVSFSNFAGLSEHDFLEALRAAAQEAKRALQVTAVLQPGLDFPWLPGFPESRHLKGVIARVPGQ